MVSMSVGVFAVCASTNGANLTDGVDGLAAGVFATALAGTGTALVLAAPPLRTVAEIWWPPPPLPPTAATVAELLPSLAKFCSAVAGSACGFLIAVNAHPARVFMGDCGSLALGGALVGAAMGAGTWVGADA